MLVTVPLFDSDTGGAGAQAVLDIYRSTYSSGLVSCPQQIGEDGFICANALSGRDDMQIFVCGCDERLLLLARFDNLGKGASGAAVECLNLAAGKEPAYSLKIKGRN